LSGIMKLSGAKMIVDKLSAIGVGPYIPILGTMEILFATLFLFRKTARLGFVLLSCYFAGAIATDLSHGLPLINAFIPLSLVWIAETIRDREIFFPVKKLQAGK
ncbi:MAG: hypothetical protein C5B52_15215, partial [Bacteroidetes bacterium]